MKYENRKFTLWRFLHMVLPDMVIHEIDKRYYIDYEKGTGKKIGVTATVNRSSPYEWHFHEKTGDRVKRVLAAAEKWGIYSEREVTVTWPPLPWKDKDNAQSLDEN